MDKTDNWTKIELDDPATYAPCDVGLIVYDSTEHTGEIHLARYEKSYSDGRYLFWADDGEQLFGVTHWQLAPNHPQ